MTERVHSQQYQIFMLGLCLYAIVALAVGSFWSLSAETQVVLDVADVGVCVLFLFDFGLSLARSPNRWRYLSTWGWIDLLSSIPAVSVLRWGRTARVVRILRLLRGVRATRAIAGAVLERRAQSVFLATLLVSILMIVLASVAVLQFETAPEANIKSGADAVWWAFVTITTVGYGDRFPVTNEGRVVAAMLMTAGVGLFGTFSGFVASWFLAPKATEQESEMGALREEIRLLRTTLQSNVS